MNAISTQDAEKIVTEKSSDELLAMLARPDRWQPPMLDAAKAGLQRRGVDFNAALPQARPEAASAACVISVTLPDGSARQYVDQDIKGSLRRDIISGLLPMSCAAKKQVVSKGKAATTSGTLRDVAKSMFSLDCLYRPVWAHAIRGIAWGAIIGIGLKLLDTAVTLFVINPLLGLLMVAAIASLFIPRGGLYVMGAIIYIMIKTGVSMNLYMMMMGAALVGALLGTLPGMAIGGLVGLVRSVSLPRAHNAVREPGVPILTAFLLPAGGGAALLYFYVFWFNPMLATWLAK